MGERIIVGGWMISTTYSVGNTYCPILNSRYGPGLPIFYLSLFAGRPRVMLYNSSGTLILDLVLRQDNGQVKRTIKQQWDTPDMRSRFDWLS